MKRHVERIARIAYVVFQVGILLNVAILAFAAFQMKLQIYIYLIGLFCLICLQTLTIFLFPFDQSENIKNEINKCSNYKTDTTTPKIVNCKIIPFCGSMITKDHNRQIGSIEEISDSTKREKNGSN